MTPKVSANDVWVIVVSWNAAGLLSSCLDAVAAQSVPARAVVVDNASEDGTRELVAARSPGVTLVSLDRNRGFAEASNVGIRLAIEARARYVALVNPDVVLEPDWLERLVADAERHPEAGVFGGLLVFADDPARVNSTGLEMDALGRVRDRDFGAEVASIARADGPVLGATGGAILLRAESLARIGLLDPAYFAYYEDADLSMRATRAGIAIRYVSGARARHGFGRSIGVGSPRQRYLLARNHLRFVASHLPLWRALPIVLAVPALRAAVKAPLELARRRPAHAVAQLRAAWDGLAVAAAALAARPRSPR